MARDDFLESIRRAAENQEKKLKGGTPTPTYIAQAKDGSGIDPRVVTYHNPKSSTAENYRIIFNRLKNTLKESNTKNIAIMSASDGEGKSITASNLSVVVSKDFGERVLLVDANLRKATIDELMNVSAKAGLSDILINSLDYRSALTPTRIGKLDVITSGRNTISPIEVLNEQKLTHFLNNARLNYDYVILDTPALIPYADSKIIASIVDGVILTVRARRKRREVIMRAKSILDELGTKIFGFVLTDVEYYIPEFIYRHL